MNDSRFVSNSGRLRGFQCCAVLRDSSTPFSAQQSPSPQETEIDFPLFINFSLFLACDNISAESTNSEVTRGRGCLLVARRAEEVCQKSGGKLKNFKQNMEKPACSRRQTSASCLGFPPFHFSNSPRRRAAEVLFGSQKQFENVKDS